MAEKKIKILRGNIWKLAEDLDFLVVPTNIGWTRSGQNVMGAGIAKQARQEDPSLAEWYGAQCQQYGADTPVLSRGRLILFPTKPLNVESPWLSWMAKASLARIEQSLLELRKFKRPDKRGKILIPLVGCGNGKLDEDDVMPLLKQQWMNRYRLVLRG